MIPVSPQAAWSAAPSAPAAGYRADRVAFALLAAALAVALGTRLWLSAHLPVADTTEARYSEIVRVGLEHGFWLMPHATATEPFFAKPPASTWLSMLSATAFGATEAMIRLPSLLLMAAIAVVCARLATRESGAAPHAGLWAAAVVLLSPLGLVMAGAVMTDAVHLFAVTAAMAGATAVVAGDGRLRARGLYLFWIALGAGTLAKGLATVALSVLPLALYALVTRRPFALARTFLAPGPIVAAVLVALPWYIAAEIAYPGFLKYFIVGEHLQRFLEPGWQGDRYGTAHREAIGTIWLYATAAFGPWLLAAAAAAFFAWRRPAAGSAYAPGAIGLGWWACWVLAPLLMFTFARNIIWTYAATALPPLAVALGVLLARSPTRRAVAGVALAWTVALASAAPWALGAVSLNSARTLIAAIPSVDPQGTLPLTVPGRMRFSGAFYSKGRACVAFNAASEAACEAASGGAGLRILTVDDARRMVASGQAEQVATDGRHALVLRPPRNGTPK